MTQPNLHNESRNGWAPLAIFIVLVTAVLVAIEQKFFSVDLVVCGFFLVFLLANGWSTSFSSWTTKLFAGVDWVAQKANFRAEMGVAKEARRINLLRIFLGLVITTRFLYTLQLSLLIDHDVGTLLVAALTLFVGISLTIGFLTPLASLTLMIGVIWSFDAEFSSFTLGTYVLQMANIILLLFPAGTALSVDAHLMCRSGFMGRLVRRLYAGFGPPSPARSRVARMVAIMSYAMLCLYSVLYHATDVAWLKGYANGQALTSFYLSKYPEFFQNFYFSSPTLFWLSSAASNYLIAFWELFFLPLLFFKIGRIFIIIVGVLFFLISAFLLNLSYLPWVEFVFFALLFWQTSFMGHGSQATVKVLFDDRCRLHPYPF